MAAHTPLSLAQARALGERWGLAVEAVEAVAAGTLNSSYALTTADGRVFLRIFEHVGAAAGETEARLLAHLAGVGVPTPAPLPRAGASSCFTAEHAGKPAIALRWVDGAIVCARAVTPAHAREVGVALATIHRAGAGQEAVPEARFHAGQLAARLASASMLRDRVDLRATVDGLHARLAALDARRLPVRGLVHGDLFRENVLWSGSTLAAVVDFEAACAGNFAFDLMIAALAWGFGDRFEPPRVRALVDGYRSVRELETGEADELYPGALTAGVRFAVTRLLDYELAPEQPGRRDFRRFLARLAAIEALGANGWRALLGL